LTISINNFTVQKRRLKAQIHNTCPRIDDPNSTVYLGARRNRLSGRRQRAETTRWTGNPPQVASESRARICRPYRTLRAFARTTLTILGAIGSASSVPKFPRHHLSATAERHAARFTVAVAFMLAWIDPWRTGVAIGNQEQRIR
jgi:hypothetical protein